MDVNIISSSNNNSQNNIKEIVDKLGDKPSKEALLESCKEFEVYFVEQMFKAMEKTIGKQEENQYTEYFGEMLTKEYAKSSTERGGFGLANHIYESMKNNYYGVNIVEQEDNGNADKNSAPSLPSST